jgi:uncharacterized protein YyaL (SSP411 family)
VDSTLLKTQIVSLRSTLKKRKVRCGCSRLISEGAYYVWTRREFDAILGLDAYIAASYWNVKKEGNVDPHHDIQGELEEQVSSTQSV